MVSLLILISKIIVVYSDERRKIYTFCGKNAELLVNKAGDTHNYHRALKGAVL